MAWIAGVLAVFLFYKFVERAHKIIFFKCCLGILVIGAIAATGVYFYSVKAKPDVEPGLTVEFRSLSPLAYTPEVDQKAWDSEAINIILRREFPNSTDEQRRYLRDYFVRDGKRPMPGTSILYDNEDAEYEAVKASNAADRAGEAESHKFFQDYLQRTADGFGTIKAKLDNDPIRVAIFVFDLVGYRLGKSVDAVGNFARVLTKDERELAGKITLLEAAFNDELVGPWNQQQPMPKSVLFVNVCNKRSKPLNSYSFAVSGYLRGRSTAYALKETPYFEATKVDGDVIVGANSCKLYDVVDVYRRYNSYKITNVVGTWATDK